MEKGIAFDSETFFVFMKEKIGESGKLSTSVSEGWRWLFLRRKSQLASFINLF